MREISSVLVSGAGIPEVNGVYNPRELTPEGYQLYRLLDPENEVWLNYIIYFNGDNWVINNPDEDTLYQTSGRLRPGAANYPWVTGYIWNVTDGVAPTPTLIEIPLVFPEPTFGLPEDTVSQITSRFGTVTNYLRLRNQGQV